MRLPERVFSRYLLYVICCCFTIKCFSLSKYQPTNQCGERSASPRSSFCALDAIISELLVLRHACHTVFSFTVSEV